MTDKIDQARLHAFVDGTVQGVGFRTYVQDQAHAMHLTGWVRNVYDGRVEILAEGPREMLELLLDNLRSGSRSAFVTNVQQEWEPATGEFFSFEIRRSI